MTVSSNKTTRVGIVRFPGTNCDRDVAQFVEAKLSQPVYLWHLDQFDTKDFDSLIVPGGFSYGDYLRSGALSARSPVMKSVREFAQRGGPILGICNGFQILTEAGLLPGALVQNRSLNFIDEWSVLKIENQSSSWGGEKIKKGSQIRLPIAHGDGRFYAPADLLKKIEDQGQVWMRYTENPNGSLSDIAGVLSSDKKIAGLMPHPERALFEWMGGTDGWEFIA